jgi:aminopeptidase
MSSIPSENMSMYMKYYQKPLHSDRRVANTKWCILRYPNSSMAQLSNMSNESFEDFYFKVCNLDYSKMSKAMDKLVTLIQKTDRVRIISKDTDLSFSIKGLPAVKCAGNFNIPDGEVFTAPVANSVNGVIKYNSPSVYRGATFENICF